MDREYDFSSLCTEDCRIISLSKTDFIKILSNS